MIHPLAKPAWWLLVLGVGGLWACSVSEPQRIKRSFVGKRVGVSRLSPKGLNPLGDAPVCSLAPATGGSENAAGQGSSNLASKQRSAENTTPHGSTQKISPPVILISNPIHFSQTATTMMVRLHQSLALTNTPSSALAPASTHPQPLQARFVLASSTLRNHAQSVRWGKRCAALLVLWETPQSKTLSLTFVHPPGAPLQVPMREEVCRFGLPAEQLLAMAATIKAVLAWRKGRAAAASFYANQANQIEHQCLPLLPLLTPKPPIPSSQQP